MFGIAHKSFKDSDSISHSDIDSHILDTGIHYPLGSVMAWLQNLGGGVPSSLPAGWKKCDGTVVVSTDPTMNGKTAPNLNGASAGTQRFLRGSTTSGGVVSGSHSHSAVVPALPCTSCSSRRCYDSVSGCCMSRDTHQHADVSATTSGCNPLPPFYEVVWIMRIQ